MLGRFQGLATPLQFPGVRGDGKILDGLLATHEVLLGQQDGRFLAVEFLLLEVIELARSGVP